MGPGDQRYSLSEAEDGKSVAQEAAGQGSLSIGKDKWDTVLGTAGPLTSNQVQCIGYIQPFIDEATSLSKKCIYKLVFTDMSSRVRNEQGAIRCVEAAA